MTYTIEELKKLEDEYGSLDLRNTPITSLPEGLTVGGYLDLYGTPITSLPEGLTVGGWVDLHGTPITSLPESLTVGGWVDLRNTPITSLPEGLTVGGYLDLSGTPITSLPEGLTVGGSLYLSGTSITSLPEGLTVGGALALRNTPITALPEGLTVGGALYLRGTGITVPANYKKLKNGMYVPGKYLYADNVLTHVKNAREKDGYTFYEGKIPGRNVVFDGKNYAHCKTFREGLEDLAFKSAKDRGAEQYKSLALDSEIPLEEAKTMYRVITGACRAGTERFLSTITPKEKYTVREIIEITEGQYGAERFKAFFEGGEK